MSWFSFRNVLCIGFLLERVMLRFFPLLFLGWGVGVGGGGCVMLRSSFGTPAVIFILDLFV